MKPPKGYLSLEEFSKRAGVVYLTAWRWIKEKKLKAIRPAKEWFIKETEVKRLLNGI